LYTVSVETHFSASHSLTLSDNSKEPQHRHNWLVTVDVSAEQLNKMGLVVDFHQLKGMVDNIVSCLADKSLDTIDYFRQSSSSAEIVARYIYEMLEPKIHGRVKLDAVRVVEEPGCYAKFSKNPN